MLAIAAFVVLVIAAGAVLTIGFVFWLIVLFAHKLPGVM